MKEEPLKTIIDSMSKSFEDEIRKSPEYVKLAKQESVDGLVQIAHHEMSMYNSKVMQVLEDVHGIKGNDAYHIIQQLPYLMGNMRKGIEEREGHVCCWDKTLSRTAELIKDTKIK